MLFRARSSLARVFLTMALGFAADVCFIQASQLSESNQQAFLGKLSAAAIERTHHIVRYDPKYVRIPYPGGDVPADTGVCSDEVIRAYRALGIDLQKEVHEDIAANFSAYPNHMRWMLFLPISPRAKDYGPGELVTWDLGGGVPHIGIVVDRKSASSGRYMVVHNIGAGPKMEDVLFSWKITGHYRYFGPQPQR
jgi:uncharacterized protein YijF (DUF1287 family)